MRGHWGPLGDVKKDRQIFLGTYYFRSDSENIENVKFWHSKTLLIWNSWFFSFSLSNFSSLVYNPKKFIEKTCKKKQQAWSKLLVVNARLVKHALIDQKSPLFPFDKMTFFLWGVDLSLIEKYLIKVQLLLFYVKLSPILIGSI